MRRATPGFSGDEADVTPAVRAGLGVSESRAAARPSKFAHWANAAQPAKPGVARRKACKTGASQR
ncbi:MAG: hypothetical protein ING73_03025 [Rhodocyclaceae bacterium]|nr:hypothetical protein [Rhodocyclaceae bacterium]MCA3024848.1 hypothetical protein [Rhodocyclaceae bacterium]MCA3032326.1 hypothetical protein [Rhodocyclaceae bacterium]MCA3037845.1 hypothetical protein [Rhodocyclaceae bacterium]MCA3039011.1 hypothetical protein [Rhodocyclaceae bacterium]